MAGSALGHGFEAVPAEGRAGGIASRLGELMRRLHYDSVLQAPDSLRALVDLVGADRVILGSDHPFTMAGAAAPRTLAVDDRLYPVQSELILSGNDERPIADVRR